MLYKITVPNMSLFKVPRWVYSHEHPFRSFEEIPVAVFNDINCKLQLVQSDKALVSIVVTAWNEEINILNCISSFSNLKSEIPFEIIVVNNNSTDHTQKTIDSLHVKKLFQEVQGCGPARQLGLENANGKYILTADADCIYPPCWLDIMMNKLKKPGVVCVYGRYSFIEAEYYPRWKLFCYEKMKDIIAELRHFKRPYLNSFGISMGYIKELALKEGYVEHNIRGEDGRLCFDLMKHGKIKQVKSSNARPWTRPRTLEIDGSFQKALFNRVVNELRRISSLFISHPRHDTKISRNE